MPPRSRKATAQRPQRRSRQLRIETSGLPERGVSDRSPELGRLIAQKFGILPKLERLPLPLPERFTDIKLGNPELPIFPYLDEIVNAVDNNSVVIGVAETGSGKSTQIAQALLERGYKVTLTQPRRIAAEMLANRITEEVGDKLGSASRMLVGFQTAEKKTISQDTRLSVVTDGLRLVQELGVLDESDDGELEVLIIDEVHERNTNIDVLMAWAQKRISEGANLRVVLTSASTNAEKLARYMDRAGIKTPIIEIPGRTHDIEKIERPESTVAEEVARYARQGKNVLAFLPGLTEIDNAIAATQKILAKDRGNFQFQRLHGRLSAREQHLVEIECEGVRLVFATNVAETSITIPDVDVIVDSGLERRVEINDEGVEGLRPGIISQASVKQRAGRCGRTKDGIYVSTRLDNRIKVEDYAPIDQRPEYSTPEILRSNVDRTVLSIACAGLDITELDLLDRLDDKKILQSKRALQILGALDEKYKATDRGKRMNNFPVRPGLSRMIVYAVESNFSEEMKCFVAAIAASIESGELPNYSREAGGQWKKLVRSKQSDLIAQLDMFIASQNMTMPEVMDNDLNERSVVRARELYERLLRRLKIRPGSELMHPSEEQRQQLIDAIASGMVDFVYEKQGPDYVRTSHKLGQQATRRAIGDRSVVQRGRASAPLIVATPYVLAPPPGRDLPEFHIVQGITEITPQVLAKVAFELCTWESGELIWRGGSPYVLEQQRFRNTVSTGDRKERPADWSLELAHELIAMSMRQPGKNLRTILDMKKESEKLAHRSLVVIPIHANKINEMLETLTGITKKSLAKKPMSVAELDLVLASKVSVFNEMMPSAVEIEKILRDSPDHIDYHGIALDIDYRKGIPHIKHISDEIKANLRQTSGAFCLPDGRDILISHTVNGRTKRLKIEEFRSQRG